MKTQFVLVLILFNGLLLSQFLPLYEKISIEPIKDSIINGENWVMFNILYGASIEYEGALRLTDKREVVFLI